MKPYRAEEATQAEFTNSNTLLEITSLSSLWNTLALLTDFNCSSKTQKEKKKTPNQHYCLTYFAVKMTRISQN